MSRRAQVSPPQLRMSGEELSRRIRWPVAGDEPCNFARPADRQVAVELLGVSVRLAGTARARDQQCFGVLRTEATMQHPSDPEMLLMRHSGFESPAGEPCVGQLLVGHGDQLGITRRRRVRCRLEAKGVVRRCPVARDACDVQGLLGGESGLEPRGPPGCTSVSMLIGALVVVLAAVLAGCGGGERTAFGERGPACPPGAGPPRGTTVTLFHETTPTEG